MDHTVVTELGVGAALAVIIVREVMQFLRERRNGGPPVELIAETLRRMDRLLESIAEHDRGVARKVDDLHLWFRPRESADGLAFSWTAPMREIKSALDGLTAEVRRLSSAVEALTERVSRLERVGE